MDLFENLHVTELVHQFVADLDSPSPIASGDRQPPQLYPDSPSPIAIMFSFLNRVLDWFKSLFWKEEMELTLVGLQYSGKTTFVNVIGW